MKWLLALADVYQADSLSSRLRRRRFALFRGLVERLGPPPGGRPLRVLDVGGTESFWRNVGFPERPGAAEILLLNVEPPPVSAAGFRSMGGDARAMPQFPDRHFDVVFSNSVIEHVGDRADQRRMAEEVRRVGRSYFIQTPSRSFPMEPHFLFPFFQHLPVEARVQLLRRLPLGWYGRVPDAAKAREIVESVQLLSEAELRGLFPTAQIYHERFLGLTKSLIAYEGFGPA